MTYEMQVNVLARIIRSGDSNSISTAIKKFEELDIFDNYTYLIDKANIPFLIACYATQNVDACRLLNQHRFLKSIQISKETPAILKDFYNGIMREYEEGAHSQDLFFVLSSMISLCNADYCRLGIRLLTELDFNVDSLEELVPRLDIIRDVLPEADSLIRKIEWLQQEEEFVDEDMDMDRVDDEEEDVIQQEEEVPEDNESILSFISDESGFDEDFEDEEDAEEVDEENRKYYISVCEVFMTVLSAIIKNGDSEQISLGIELISEMELPLYAFHKHEISALITEHAVYSNEAFELWRSINRLEDSILAEEKLETFNYIVKFAEEATVISKALMAILVDYMTTEEYHMDRVIQLFLEKDISLDLFQDQEIKQFLLQYPAKNDEIWMLILKIREMEDAQ